MVVRVGYESYYIGDIGDHDEVFCVAIYDVYGDYLGFQLDEIRLLPVDLVVGGLATSVTLTITIYVHTVCSFVGVTTFTMAVVYYAIFV